MGEYFVGEIGSRSGDSGAPKLVWSNGEVVVAAVTRLEYEGSRPIRVFSKVSGGGIVRGLARAAAVDGVLSRGVGETDDDGDGDDDSVSEGSAGAEFCESCEWLRTGGGSSVGIGGGIVATV